MERKGCAEHPMTVLAQSDYRPDFIALRTVLIKLMNGNRSLRVKSLLDDVSTKHTTMQMSPQHRAFVEKGKDKYKYIDGQEKH